MPADIRTVAPAARRASSPGRSPRNVFCFFDNTEKIHAPANALRLAGPLGLGTGLRITR